MRASNDGQAPVIGGITSSARSPMLGDAIIGFAQIKWGHHTAGTELFVQVGDACVRATVQAQLAFWSRT